MVVVVVVAVGGDLPPPGSLDESIRVACGLMPFHSFGLCPYMTWAIGSGCCCMLWAPGDEAVENLVHDIKRR